MSLAAIVRAMALSGCTPDQIAAAVEAAEAEKRAADDARKVKARDKKRRQPNSGWERLRIMAFERDGYTCVYCHQVCDAPHADHILPVSRGGLASLDNLATACPRCNIAKSDRTPEEWRCQ